jgi:hypothetical protein
MGEIDGKAQGQNVAQVWLFTVQEIIEFLVQLDPSKRVAVHQSVADGLSHVTLTFPNTTIMGVVKS